MARMTFRDFTLTKALMLMGLMMLAVALTYNAGQGSAEYGYEGLTPMPASAPAGLPELPKLWSL
jgi:hypothetical protein